jgi:hypothetical protein
MDFGSGRINLNILDGWLDKRSKIADLDNIDALDASARLALVGVPVRVWTKALD